jgi:tRNA-2-methylthio-N6-dimethylallyladenosine synthase
MDDEFIEEFASNPKICKSIHMPLQSGSSKVLKDMKRGYTKEWFVNRAKKIRELVTDVSISTDIIVGFPDESDSDFEDTMDIMKEIKFEQIFSFKYSPRPNTQSLNMKNRVEDKIASSRLSRVIDKHKQDLDDITTSQIGKIHIVLFEELKVDGYVFGKSDNNFTIKVKGSQELLGEIKEVKIIASNRMYLEGEIVERR